MENILQLLSIQNLPTTVFLCPLKARVVDACYDESLNLSQTNSRDK